MLIHKPILHSILYPAYHGTALFAMEQHPQRRPPASRPPTAPRPNSHIDRQVSVKCHLMPNAPRKVRSSARGDGARPWRARSGRSRCLNNSNVRCSLIDFRGKGALRRGHGARREEGEGGRRGRGGKEGGSGEGRRKIGGYVCR